MSDEPSDAERLVGALIGELYAHGGLDDDSLERMAARLPEELRLAVMGYAVQGCSKPESEWRAEQVRSRFRVVD